VLKHHNSTTAMRTHFARFHPALQNELLGKEIEANSAEGLASLFSASPLTRKTQILTSAKKEAMLVALTSMLAKDSRPVSMAVTPAFKHLLSVLTDGGFEGPCRQTLTSVSAQDEQRVVHVRCQVSLLHLTKEFAYTCTLASLKLSADICAPLDALQTMTELAVRAKIKLAQRLKAEVAMGRTVSILLDIWSENGISMLGIMATFINKNWEVEELMVRACPFTDVPHTGANILGVVKETLYLVGLATRKEVEQDGAANATTLVRLPSCM
jgi:hypothetical protein